MENTVTKRIEQAIKHYGLSNRQLELELEISEGYLSNQFRNNRNMGSETVMKIYQHLHDINPGWILGDKVPMLKENSDYLNEPPPTYRRLGPFEKAILEALDHPEIKKKIKELIQVASHK